MKEIRIDLNTVDTEAMEKLYEILNTGDFEVFFKHCTWRGRNLYILSGQDLPTVSEIIDDLGISAESK